MNTSDTFHLQAGSLQPNLQHYLIANRLPGSMPNLMADMYAHNGGADNAILYLNSELSELLEVSPYVIRVHEGDFVLKQYERNAVVQNGWSGIVISVADTTSFDELLMHLRQRLLVLFSSDRKGVLHFSNPNVANYWFGEADTNETAVWLGPIKQVWWYGANNSPNQALWCHIWNLLDAPPVDTSPPPSLWSITESQKAALELKKVDKVLAVFFLSASISVKSSQQWLRYRSFFCDASTLGLTERDNVYQYLLLCNEHDHANENLDDNFREVGADGNNLDKSLIESLDVAFIQTLSESKKLHHIKTRLKRDRSYANG
ncbi:DUF4123 domain-containing protein [Marinomonas primoryensis]|uniref:DUF4123 domain-containing protein n=1 Tax=Marinomonas primoryensis TaxID=178399 RepID=A0ABV0L554_9GAMM